MTITDEQFAAVAHLTGGQIAIRLGINSGYAYHLKRRFRQRGTFTPLPPQHPPRNTEQEAICIDLYGRGYTLRQIGAQFGFSHNRAGYIIRRYQREQAHETPIGGKA